MLDDTESWTLFDKRAENLSHHVILGTVVGECYMARVKIDDKTGHVMSLKYAKHMNGKDVYRNLPSVRDPRTLLLHCSRSLHNLLTKPDTWHHKLNQL